jgi:hypothetical protein
MSDKARKKKNNRDANKKRQRMRGAVAARRRSRKATRGQRDEVDTVKFKRGSASDRTRAGAP